MVFPFCIEVSGHGGEGVSGVLNYCIKNCSHPFTEPQFLLSWQCRSRRLPIAHPCDPLTVSGGLNLARTLQCTKKKNNLSNGSPLPLSHKISTENSILLDQTSYTVVGLIFHGWSKRPPQVGSAAGQRTA